jgi:hypothetical protein
MRGRHLCVRPLASVMSRYAWAEYSVGIPIYIRDSVQNHLERLMFLPTAYC